MRKAEREARSAELLQLVGVDPSRLSSFPHELSGGMRQRVMIAMALSLDPQVMIMDEPTTALDVVVQRGIIREIMRLRERLGFAVIFITHDLPLLIEISDRIAVMREGRIVEQGTAEQIYRQPADDVHEAAAGELPEPHRRPRRVHPRPRRDGPLHGDGGHRAPKGRHERHRVAGDGTLEAREPRQGLPPAVGPLRSRRSTRSRTSRSRSSRAGRSPSSARAGRASRRSRA